MHNRFLSVFFVVIACFFTLGSSCIAADNVVVIPVGSSLFKGDQYLTISSAAFTPNSHLTEYDKPVNPISHNSYGYLELKTSPSDGFLASVTLPDGAVVSQLSAYVKRQGGECHMTFGKHRLIKAQHTEIVDITPLFMGMGQYGPVHGDIADEKIDNMNYQYHLAWTCGGLPALDRLYAVRIKYRLR